MSEDQRSNKEECHADEPHIAAFVCPHVFRNERPVLLVLHMDGDWQLMCGGMDHDDEGHVVGLSHLLERDRSLQEVMDLPIDWEAERSAPGMAWLRTRCVLDD